MPEEARHGTREDAVVIPIGTGGRPGRGSGKARPSSAARNLAPSAGKAPRKRAATTSGKAAPRATAARKAAPAPRR